MSRRLTYKVEVCVIEIFKLFFLLDHTVILKSNICAIYQS